MRELFANQGFVTGLTILTPAEVIRYREAFDRFEQEAGRKASQVGIANRHKDTPAIWELVTHPRVIAAIEQLLGPDLLLLGSHFFCKYPDLSESFVSWHQDVTYWGLNPPKALTMWLAIDDADAENGCMRVVPRSHKSLLPHGKAEKSGNLLSVNQEISRTLVDESQAVDLPLRAGQASLHDGLLIHGSNPNRSTRRRCGLTLRFTTPEVQWARDDPNAVRWKPILLRGEDRFGHFDLDPAPALAAS